MSRKKRLLRIAAPMMLSQIMIFSTPIIDTMFLSVISLKATASVGLVTPLVFLLSQVVWIVSFSGSSIANQVLGKTRNQSELYSAFLVVGFVLFITALALLAISKVGLNIWSTIFPSNNGLQYLAVSYLHVYAYCLPSIAIIYFGQSVCNSSGREKLVPLITGASFLVNLGGNCVSVYFFGKLEEKGLHYIALSSVFAAAVSAVMYLGILSKVYVLGKNRKTSISHITGILKRIVRIAAPSVLEPMSFELSLFSQNYFLSYFSSSALAAKVLIYNSFMLVLITTIGLSTALDIELSRYMGSDKKDQMRLTLNAATKLTVSFALAMALSITLIWKALEYSNLIENTHLFVLASTAVFLAFISEPFRATNLIFGNTLKISGFAIFLSISNILYTWLVIVPIAYLLIVQLELGLVGAFLAIMIDELGRTIISYFKLCSLSWFSPRFLDSQ